MAIITLVAICMEINIGNKCFCPTLTSFYYPGSSRVASQLSRAPDGQRLRAPTGGTCRNCSKFLWCYNRPYRLKNVFQVECDALLALYSFHAASFNAHYFYYLQKRFGFFFLMLEKTALLLSEVQGGQERILEIELFNLVAPAVLAGSSLTGTQVQQQRQVMKNVALQHFSVNNKAHLFVSARHCMQHTFQIQLISK